MKVIKKHRASCLVEFFQFSFEFSIMLLHLLVNLIELTTTAVPSPRVWYQAAGVEARV